jgi:hypothetical protein
MPGALCGQMIARVGGQEFRQWVVLSLYLLLGTSKIWCLQRTSLNIQGRTEAAWQEPSIEDSGQIDKKAMIPWSDLMQTPSGSKCAGDTEES